MTFEFLSIFHDFSMTFQENLFFQDFQWFSMTVGTLENYPNTWCWATPPQTTCANKPQHWTQLHRRVYAFIWHTRTHHRQQTRQVFPNHVIPEDLTHGCDVPGTCVDVAVSFVACSVNTDKAVMVRGWQEPSVVQEFAQNHVCWKHFNFKKCWVTKK